MQNAPYLNYKLHPEEESESYDDPASSSRKFKVKELLRRYRNEAHFESTEEQLLKAKLFNSYEKLQSQMSQNQRLKDIIVDLEMKSQQVQSQNSELKGLLHKVIQNRKHLERELEQATKANENLKGDLEESKKREESLRQENGLLKQSQQQLSQTIQRNSKQMQTLEAIITERNYSIDRLTQSIRNLPNTHTGDQDAAHQSGRKNVNLDNISYKLNNENIQPNENKPRREREFKVGKWKKNVPTIKQPEEKIDLEGRESLRHGKIEAEKEEKIEVVSSLTDDQLLTVEQNRKRVLSEELSKLEKIKKPGVHQIRRIEEVESQLDRVDSNICRLKRKIRSKY